MGLRAWLSGSDTASPIACSRERAHGVEHFNAAAASVDQASLSN